MAGRPEGFAPRGAVEPGFAVAPVFAVAPAFAVATAVFDATAEFFVRGVADPATVRGVDDVVDTDDTPGDSDGAGVRDGTGVREGCAGTPIAGASAWTPTKLPAIATARIAPTTETGQPIPRSRRPRVPDRSTNTGAGANSRKRDRDVSGSAGRTGPRWLELIVWRTLRSLSLQGTWIAGSQGER
ncbi:hypothetical protein [Streptomyces virginiae]|uniref:hypothetical protein n=1 Tax=Streptomyces virginiae TaxID=1961 RepID=UPI0036AEEE6E